MPQTPEHVIGALTGTSCDEINAVLLGIDKDTLTLIDMSHAPIDSALSHQVLQSIEDKHIALPLLAEWEQHLAAQAIDAIDRLKNQHANCLIKAVGWHGHTVWHAPPFSYQTDGSAQIAQAIGCPVVSKFRQSDLARGGQGAPLAPVFHAALFGSEMPNGIAINLGGIANISVIKNGQAVAGWDTGPANALMDWVARARLDLPFDKGGLVAKQGKCDQSLLDTWLSDDYFQRPAPKSTGKEYFNHQFIEQGLHLDTEDLLATLCELTACSLVHGIQQAKNLFGQAILSEIYLMGGGVYNEHLVSLIKSKLKTLSGAPQKLVRHQQPMAIEGGLFAWLAYQRMQGLPIDSSPITGAATSGLLGEITHP